MENSAPQTPLLHLIGQTCRLHRHGAPSPSDHAPIVGVRAGTFDSPNPKAVVLLHAAPHVLAKRHQPKVRYRRHNVREIVNRDVNLYRLIAGALHARPDGSLTLTYAAPNTRLYTTRASALAELRQHWITGDPAPEPAEQPQYRRAPRPSKPAAKVWQKRAPNANSLTC